MRVYDGNNEIDLTQKQFVAKGGEASVYHRGGTAYKIYEDAVKMFPAAKIKELSALTLSNIIKPERVITNVSHTPIGYSMRYVDDTYSLCQIFTKAFQQRYNLKINSIVDLIKKFAEIMRHVHSKSILVVDVNELNFLASNDFKEIYAIDVNSYQTKSFPATAIMENIRDRHNKKFSEGTDWFSWGLVSFQMLIGIHPYRGKHPSYDKMPIDERIDARMKDNISVFHDSVSIPAICQSLDIIPLGLKDWYISVFENGVRSTPPDNFEIATKAALRITRMSGSNLFDIKSIFKFIEDIKSIHYFNGKRFTVSENLINNWDYNLKDGVLGFYGQGKPVAASIEAKQLKLIDIITKNEIPISCVADGLTESDGRLYVRNGPNIIEIKIEEMGGSAKAFQYMVGRALDVDATRVFDGVVIQNLMGRWHASIFPKSGYCYTLKFEELDGYRVIDAKYKNNVLVAIGIKNGKYDRFVFRFSPNYQSHDCRKVENISFTGINFAVRERGIACLLNENEELELFSNKLGSTQLQIYDDLIAKNDIVLYNDGDSIVFTNGKELYSLKSKGKP